MTHNQKDAASEYRKMVAAAAYERKQLRASVRATGSDMVSTRSDIASIHATQAAIQTALAKITEELTPRKSPVQPPTPPTKSPRRQRRNPTNEFRLDHLPIKTHQDHQGKWYGTSDVVWKLGDRVFYKTLHLLEQMVLTRKQLQ